MSDNTVSRTRTKLYEGPEDDPTEAAAKADDKAKAEWEARKRAEDDICTADPGHLLCAPKDRTPGGPTYQELAKNLPATKPDALAEREAMQKEANDLADRLSHNPVAYVGKKEDQARLAELQKKLATQPAPDFYSLPKTNDAGRKAGAPDGAWHGATGHDGASLWAGGTAYKKSAGGAKVELADASAQFGASTEAQVTTARATVEGPVGSLVVEGPSVKYAGGFGRNDDGSVGYHAGMSANLGQLQTTVDLGDGTSGTVGISEGAGVGGSIGTKTGPNGETVGCVQVSALFFTLGACHRM